MTFDIAPIVAIFAMIGGSVGSAVGLGWWLSGRFREAENNQLVQLNHHEMRDQKRHEENLERFRHISIALARLGYTDGGP
jgi:membrane protein YqaA with SNARE-associated domain